MFDICKNDTHCHINNNSKHTVVFSPKNNFRKNFEIQFCHIFSIVLGRKKMITSNRKLQLIAMLVVCLIVAVIATKNDDQDKPAWAKKKITDYSDADMERLLDQWNVSKMHDRRCELND